MVDLIPKGQIGFLVLRKNTILLCKKYNSWHLRKNIISNLTQYIPEVPCISTMLLFNPCLREA